MNRGKTVVVKISGFLASVLLILVAGTAMPGQTVQGPRSDSVQGWISKHARDDMAPLYAAISALPKGQRKRVVVALPAEVRSQVWQMHLTLYLSQHPELTEPQKNLVRAAMAFATPDLFGLSSSHPDWETKVAVPAGVFTQRAFQLFPLPVAQEIFSHIGIPEESSPVGQEQLESIITEGGSCGCSSTFWDCSWLTGESCLTKGTDCEVTDGGCGFLGLSDCVGICFSILN